MTPGDVLFQVQQRLCMQSCIVLVSTSSQACNKQATLLECLPSCVIHVVLGGNVMIT